MQNQRPHFTLQHLNHASCPVCEASIKTVTIHSPRHTNGEQSEEIEFNCYCRIRWSPNFSREEVAQPCCHAHDRFVALKKKVGSQQ